MSDENKIEEWIPDVEEYNLDNKYKFKCLLEYFVTHLEYIINEDANFVGYEKYLKSLVETNVFKEAGQGHKGHNIQKQIERWNNYNGNVICINIYASNPQSKATYLNWKSSWYNVRAEFKNEHVDSLYITEEEHKDAKSELKYSVDKLGLFSGLSTNEFNEFFDKYMSYMNVNQTTNNDNKYQEYIDILEANKNLILNGAPGTGKTWLAKKIAKKMGCSDNEIGFVQFHPSYDYTDFVEGLRPDEKDGNVGFKRKDGVFKEFCEKAIKNSNDNSIESVSGNESESRCNSTLPLDSVSNSVSDDEFEWRYNRLLNDIKSKKCGYEAYSTDGAYYPTSIYNDDIRFKLPREFKIIQKDDVRKIYCSDEIRGKTPYDIKNLKKEDIEKIYEINNEGNKKSLNYTLVRWILEKIAEYKIENQNNIDVSESSNSPTKFVFIIDEINRGEISKIFGELFNCIDPGYRGTQGRVYTQYQNLVPEGDVFKKGFYVPDNVYIIGTMNDIDRSVESMDFAFRRRFAFKEIKANENLDMLNDLGEDLSGKSKSRLINLNNKISEIEGLDSSYHIGASYFLKLKDYQGDFGKLWDYHLEGLLREYMRGMSDVETKLESLKVAYDNESVSNN